jgi:hypothetical protein
MPKTIAMIGVAEVSYIAFQAARGVASHFNESTPLEAALFHLMGIGAVLMTAGSLAIGILIARSGGQGLSPAFRRGVVAGLVLTFVLGAGAGAVIAVNGGHWVGGVRSDAGGLPIFGWARDGGDLRVAHFFGIHAMQVLPVFALAAERVAPRRAALLVAVFAVAYSALTPGVLAQALEGQPFL